ncbi:unnamed protein product [Urochloa decumbens]|uniref:Transposase MuDR plant domain-containing protein n=1 Tax=Urochloa decumbens TaxID=240449 RepID=A0ABC9CKW3_9POAL
MFNTGHVDEVLTLRGRFDAGDKRSHYVLIPIQKADDWLLYKELLKESQVHCAEIFVDVCGRDVSDDLVEHLTQEDLPPCNANDDEIDDELSDDDEEYADEEASGDEGDFDTCAVNNHFDGSTFENEERDDDDMSQGSDEDGGDDDVVGFEQENIPRREVPLPEPSPILVQPVSFRQPPAHVVYQSVEETVMEPIPTSEAAHVVNERVEERVRQPMASNEATSSQPTPVDNASVQEPLRAHMSTLSGVRLSPLTPLEQRQLQAVHVEVPQVPLFHSIPRKAYCDSGLRLGSIEPDSGEDLISKGMIFDSLEELKFFMRDYSVRHHRPYDVVHSSAKLRYTVRCQQGCDWK